MVLVLDTEEQTAAPAAGMKVLSRHEQPAVLLHDLRSGPEPEPVHFCNHDIEADLPPELLAPGPRTTPRPTFVENIVNPRETHCTLRRRNSSELVRYFVRLSLKGSLCLTLFFSFFFFENQKKIKIKIKVLRLIMVLAWTS